MTSALHQVVEQSHSLAVSTKARYLRDLNAWTMFAGAEPSGWTRKKVHDFYSSMLLRGLKPQSANRVLASVQYASKWWATNEGNPALDFAKQIQTAPPKRKAKREALTEAEATDLLGPMLYERDSAIDARDLAMLVLMLETGMRRMSLQSMQIETTSIVWDENEPPHALVLIKGGNEEPFNVPLTDACVVALRPWLGYLARNHVRHGPVFRSLWRKGDAYVIHETAIGRNAIASMVTDRALAVGIKRSIHPHLFRHTFVTWRMGAGYSPHDVAAMTGHKLKGLGALGGYIDISAYRERIRTSTPPFLRNLLGVP